MRLPWTKVMLASCMWAAALAAAQTPRSADFALRLPLTTAGDGLHVIELPESVYRAAQTRNLADLRIFNAQDQALPIAFVPAPAPVAPVPTAVDLRLARLPLQSDARESLLRSFALRVERDRERAVVEIGPLSAPPNAASDESSIGGYLIDARPLKDLKGRLVLTFAPGAVDYAGRVDVLGSDDLVFWRPLTSGALSRSRSLGDVVERNRFELERPPAFLRVSWTSKSAPDLDRAHFVEHVAPSVTLPRAVLAATMSDDRRHLYVDVPEALPITRVLVRVPELNRFVRAQVYRHDAAPSLRARRHGLGPRRTEEKWQLIGAVEAFRVLRDGVEIEGAALALPIRTDRLRFDFAMPLDGAAPTIEAEWRPARAVFAARAPGPYQLAVGLADAPVGPALDARSMLAADDPAATRLPVATVALSGDAVTLQQRRAQRIASEARWSRYLLWGVLALAVLGLAWMAWRLSSQLRQRPLPSTEAEPDSQSAK
ncbi:MAG: DUF3999 family protein [Burkholderiaceae bacterium]